MSFRVRPGHKGLAMRLHDLEARVMDVVWSRGLRSFAVAEVHAVLEAERDIAYTTVMTTLARLHEKGLLARRREGKRHLYDPALSREAFLESTAREVLDSAVNEQRAMALLVEKVSEASADDLDELEAVIRRRREELRS